MAWSASAAFRAYYTDLVQGVVENQGAASMDFVEATTVKAALYGNTITPDKDVASASSAYNTGVWVVGGEISDGANWAAGGVAITGRSITNPSTGVVMYDATDTPSTTTTTTLAAVFGCLVYSDSIITPVADQGFSFHYFGGTQSVTSGTFTIVWHANGLIRITV